MPSPIPPEPPRDCTLCPRLADFIEAQRGPHPEWHNAPVDSFGDPDAQLLIIGLAPGLQGANRTGRPFTGDYAGDLLYGTLDEYGYCVGKYDRRPDDGLALTNAMITNAVRCVPPANKPTGKEIGTCRDFLLARMAAMPNLKVLMALGKIAHDSTLRALGQRVAAYPFGHCSRYELPLGDRSVTLISSYHCSRYNTNTGRLTPDMFRQVFDRISEELGANSKA